MNPSVSDSAHSLDDFKQLKTGEFRVGRTHPLYQIYMCVHGYVKTYRSKAVWSRHMELQMCA